MASKIVEASMASTSTSYTTWILSGILSGILIAFEEFLVAFQELKDKNMDESLRKPRHAQS